MGRTSSSPLFLSPPPPQPLPEKSLLELLWLCRQLKIVNFEDKMFAVWLRLWSWVCGNFLAHFMLRPILPLLTLLARLHNHIKTFFGNLSYHNVGREGHQSYTSLHTNYISVVADLTGLFKK